MAVQSKLPRSSPSSAPKNTPLLATDVETANMRPRALCAREAGEYLARIIGRAEPFAAEQMWAMARAHQVPVVRIGRRCYWQNDALDAFVLAGGTAQVAK